MCGIKLFIHSQIIISIEFVKYCTLPDNTGQVISINTYLPLKHRVLLAGTYEQNVSNIQ